MKKAHQGAEKARQEMQRTLEQMKKVQEEMEKVREEMLKDFQSPLPVKEPAQQNIQEMESTLKNLEEQN